MSDYLNRGPNRRRDPMTEVLGHGEVSTVDRRVARIAPSNRRGRGGIDSVIARLRRAFARRKR